MLTDSQHPTNRLSLMLLKHAFANPPPMAADYAERMEGPDQGIVNAWLAGIAMRRDTECAQQASALAGELPVLPYRGGVERKLKIKQKIGALHYLAMWQGLRGDDLDIDTETEPELICTKTGVLVLFTLDYKKLMGASNED